ncbi:hypothetical protein DIPPA_00852 [Diplonema papillatum]|nr:hypothetical protein DIPPA_00852 [Diplonema papillatum]
MLNGTKIDIELFDECKTEPPVITSPRSLEACCCLGIDPARLVYQPLASFSLVSKSPEEAALRYDHWKAKRDALVREVRMKRQLLILENEKEEDMEILLVPSAKPSDASSSRPCRPKRDHSAMTSNEDYQRQQRLLNRIAEKSERAEAARNRLLCPPQRLLRDGEKRAEIILKAHHARQQRDAAAAAEFDAKELHRIAAVDRRTVTKADEIIHKRSVAAARGASALDRCTVINTVTLERWKQRAARFAEQGKRLEGLAREKQTARDLLAKEQDALRQEHIAAAKRRDEFRRREISRRHEKINDCVSNHVQKRAQEAIYHSLLAAQKADRRRQAHHCVAHRDEEARSAIERKLAQEGAAVAANLNALEMQRRLQRVRKELLYADRVDAAMRARRKADFAAIFVEREPAAAQRQPRKLAPLPIDAQFDTFQSR